MSKTYEIAVQREINELYQDIFNAIKKGRAVKVEVKSVATKTQAQLGYWHAVVVPHVRRGLERQGNEMSHVEVNRFLNEKFFSKDKVIVWKVGNDEHCHTIRTAKSKSGASRDEMYEVTEKVRRWSALDLGEYIPSPNEYENVPF